MSKQFALGLTPRNTLWSRYTANAMFAYLFGDGSGQDFAEVNGAANSANYTGTTPTWTAFGASLAGDGGAILPALVNSVFDLTRECRVLVSAWLMITDATMSNQDTVFCAGPDNNTAANLPGVGHFRMQIANLSSNIRAQIVYRNAGLDASSPANQTVALASNIGNAADTLVHVGAILHSTGIIIDEAGQSSFTVDYQTWLNGAPLAAANFTSDGTGPMRLDSSVGQCIIGAAITKANTIKASARFGENTDSQLHGLVLWRKNNATAIEASALMTDLYKYRREASRYL